jgi:hypothetical protein
MKRITIATLAFALLLFSGCSRSAPEPPEQAEVESAVQSARQVSDDMGNQLRQMLLAEIERGGYPGAVQVCANVAQEISNDFSRETGHSVRRVSLRYRNPENRPDSYEEVKLQEMAQLRADNRLPEEIHEVSEDSGETYLRYMRPIVTAPLCVNCHGPRESLSPEVAAIIAQHYPEDQAVGFQSGDLRGAFSVKIALPGSAR